MALLGLSLVLITTSLVPAAPAERPDLDYFQVTNIPLDGNDAPAICNHWLWAQAGVAERDGILNMEDVRPGAQPQFHGTTLVSVNGQLLRPTLKTADWWPNKVTRRATVDGVHFQGTVMAAREKYALLNRLVISNATAQPKTITLELSFTPNRGVHGTVEPPTSRSQASGKEVCRFENLLLAPGASRVFRAVNLYRGNEPERDHILARFEQEWQAGDAYWNELLEDAYTPGPGPFLSGGAPRFVTSDAAAQRFHNFGVVTALMLLKRDPDKAVPGNLYVTSLPDEAYGTSSYVWDVGYASELLAMMDPAALRTMIERWALADVHALLSVSYDSSPTGFARGRFYASNGSMFFFNAWNYINYTGDYTWLDKRVGDRTMLEHLRRAADWHKTRPQWNGLAHYGEEENLFDDLTVPGYRHFVAAPNAADVWVNRALADLYERFRHDSTTAGQLRAEAGRIAGALNAHLYNARDLHAGTWKQRHLDGKELEIRHSWDFMCAGSFMAPDLAPQQKQQMRDWFMGNLVRAGSDDRWVVAQDPRDGNNGPHQQEHNGRGAYPAWPYHDGWALHAMGFQPDVIKLLRVIQHVPALGAIGQGHSPNGRRCRSNWASIAGASAAAYLPHNVFDIWPGLDRFDPKPQLAGFDPTARFDNVPVRGTLYRVTARGAEGMAGQSAQLQTPPASVSKLAWPEITRTARPWAYWWWLGSAVDQTNLLREFARYREGGLGGMHIVPIYGAKGWETNFIEYLTPRWMDMLRFAVKEADRFDLGVDMTLGTGWCFGGPNITDRHANANVVVKSFELAAGARLTNRLDPAATLTLAAFSRDGRTVELTDRLRADGTVDWTAEGAPWSVYAVSQKPSGNLVDRAAPGGEGPMLNPFFPEAIQHYLLRFNNAFSNYPGPMPRAIYHDSYEYVGNWSPDLFVQFEKRRGYRLQQHLDKFFGKAGDDITARLKSDYRETLSDLMTEQFNPAWIGWARARGALTRNQAHGSPANLLDFYAAADIPETEMFNKDRDILVSKFATSAAHVTGRPLASSETGTWLKEHFTETLADVKQLVDELFVSGVNHVFYHGTCYSPDEAGWPGWLFYASTEMNPRNAIWRDAPVLNSYIARCQSVLQTGRPDNDLLLYWPIHDFWHSPEGMERSFSVHRRHWLHEQRLGPVAQRLWQRGFAFDYVSDRQLASAATRDGAVVMPGGAYRAIVVPACEHIPLSTMKQLLALAQGGATVIFDEHLPKDVPGLAQLEQRRGELSRLLAPLNSGSETAAGDARELPLGKGRVLVGDLGAGLAKASVAREPMAGREGLLFVRRAWESGRHYFLFNHGKEPLEQWVPLATRAAAVALMDPMSGRMGLGAIRRPEDARTEVYLRLEPGESLILRTFSDKQPEAPAWVYLTPAGSPVELHGTWSVKFLRGGPELPQPFTTARLASWTELGDDEARRFAGTAVYSLEFDLPSDLHTPNAQSQILLDLGKVCHSARVRLNGRELGARFMPPYQVAASNLKPKGNRLEVEVTNLSANRIRDLDRRGVKWKSFYNINFVSINYQSFDASQWPLAESGLLGPVTMRVMKAETNITARTRLRSPGSSTVALWLFDEPDYLNATLTDATQNFYDLRLLPAGKISPGRFGSAISRRSPEPGQAVSFAEDCRHFPNDWEGTLKDRPAKPPAKLIETLQQQDWTWEFWLQLERQPAADVVLIDAGTRAFFCSLSPDRRGFVVESALAPMRFLAPCDERVWDRSWHHVAFTWSNDHRALTCFVDGRPQAAARDLSAEPPAAGEDSAASGQHRAGLAGQVYAEADFTRPVSREISRQIDFDLGSSRGTGWAERWQGFLTAPVTGRLTFRAETASDVRLQLAGGIVINSWGGATERSGSLEVVQGRRYPLLLEFAHRGPSARLRLLWSWPGRREEIVPAAAFSHTAGDAGLEAFAPRFDLALLSDQNGARPAAASLDEMRVSSGIRYANAFPVPPSFSTRSRQAATNSPTSAALPLLFDPLPSGLPVKLGARKHLFLDDALIARSEQVSFVQSQPVKSEDTSLSSLGDASVVDEGDHVKLYHGGWEDGVSLSTSRDGLNFGAPVQVWPSPGQANFFLDTRPNTPAAERLKGIAFIMTRGIYGLSSADGIHWSRNESLLLPFDCGGGVEPYWDDQRGRYVCHIRHEGHYARARGQQRIAARGEAGEFFAPWPFTPDSNPVPRKAFTLPALWQELPTPFVPSASGEVYRSRAIKYPWAPDAYLAFVWRFQAKGSDGDEALQTELGVSRNGRDWRFLGVTPAYLPAGMKFANGEAAKSIACALGLARRGDELWQYANLRATVHRGGASKVVRLTQRLDGFVALQAGDTNGGFATHPLVFDGSQLALNAAVQGALRVEIQDETGRPLPGLTLEDCEPLRGDSTRLLVRWRGRDSLKSVAGQPVRLRFQMRNAKLFALQFVP